MSSPTAVKRPIEEAREVREDLDVAMDGEIAPLVFLTVVDESVRQELLRTRAPVIDFVSGHLAQLEAQLGVTGDHAPARLHGVGDSRRYNRRMQAVEFAIEHDDGSLSLVVMDFRDPRGEARPMELTVPGSRDEARVSTLTGQRWSQHYPEAALFDDARLVNEVRGMEAYTGTVGGRPISVMGSGMGMPTMTIYATELYREYGVQRIIRVGTSGGFQDDLALGDVIVATAAHTDSAINDPRIPGVKFAPAASYPLLRAAVDAAERAGTPVRVGAVYSSDHFYLARPGLHEGLRDHGVLGVDMETAALYAVAAAEGRECQIPRWLSARECNRA